MIKRWFLLLVFLPFVWAEEKNGVFTHEEALKFTRTVNGKKLGEFWFESGERQGPYRHAGRVLLSPGAHITYQYADGRETLRNETGLYVDEEYWQVRLDFFTSEKGEGWVVCNIVKPEIEPTRPKPKKDERPAVHKALASAAEMAIKTGDLDFLKVLIAKGLQINESLDFEKNETALYQSVSSRKLAIFKYLLENGADPIIKNSYGERPIDLAVEWDMENFIKLLDKGKVADEMIDGVPSGVLEKVFGAYKTDEEYFISWNGKDANAEQAKFLKNLLGSARPKSDMETLENRPTGAHTWYRDKKDGKYGRLLQLEIKQNDEKWDVRLRDTAGPSMAGGGWSGIVQKKYGYWFLDQKESWGE